MNVILDVDGVLADFVGAALKAHGKQGHKVTHWNFYKDWGINEHQFWEKCRGKGFWGSIEKTPWADDLVDGLFDAGHAIHVATSPSSDYECAAAKFEWIDKVIGIGPVDVTVTSSKELLAKPDTVLIDDNNENCNRFREAGGKAILFPQPWNMNYVLADHDRVAWTLETLKILSQTPANHNPPAGMTKHSTGAVRSSDRDGERWDLISPIGLREVAKTCHEGAVKYSPYNWEKGFSITGLLNHVIPHCYLYLAGDRSEPHLAHAAWGCLAAIHSEKLWPHLNQDLRGPGCTPPAETSQTT